MYVYGNQAKQRTKDMTAQFITNTFGVKFYIEKSSDFNDQGCIIPGRGWHAGLMDGDSMAGGIFFETKDAALRAISEYRG